MTAPAPQSSAQQVLDRLQGELDAAERKFSAAQVAYEQARADVLRARRRYNDAGRIWVDGHARRALSAPEGVS